VTLLVRTVDAFLLSREWRDRDDGVEIVLWARSKEAPVRARISRQEAVMFVPRATRARADRRASRLLEAPGGGPVDALYFRSQRALVAERERVRSEGGVTLESDVKPHDRFLMERFVTAPLMLHGRSTERDGVIFFDDPSVKAARVRPALSVLVLDIETQSWDGPLLSAAVATKTHERVFVQGEGRDDETVRFVPDERALLLAFMAEIRANDPDVLAGWNVTDFDLSVLEARCNLHRLPFAIGRAGELGRVLRARTADRVSVARVPGRVVLDGIATLRSATHRFERFTLEHVSRELLGRGKRIANGGDALEEILRMHREDRAALAAYNLEDCRLVLEIFERADLVEFAMARAELTGLAMDRQGGSVAAFDHLYLPRLHRKGIVAHDVGRSATFETSPGGHVLDSLPGLYENVLSFDFRSLYPSIIRTFQIDPFGLIRPGKCPIAGSDGAAFARQGAILPELITTLHEARSVAMESKNAALSRAIKILMNSFYGVLGTPGCRFFDPRLPTSITRRGRAIIERARSFFLGRGYPVLYGDTDSLFVHVVGPLSEKDAKDLGRALAAELTRTLEDEIRRELEVLSLLELRFESHYLRFLMPTTRGAERGSKKRYAGLIRGMDGKTGVVVRGLEAVRTDWTPLARRVQKELLRRIFEHEPFTEWIQRVAGDLASGALDDELVYRKRLRRELALYAEAGAPPHVRAARLSGGVAVGAEIEYVMTLSGPELTSQRRSSIDREHYLESQLAPACDVVLPFVGTSFERTAGVQQNLF
jgi:DNA polymerase-2